MIFDFERCIYEPESWCLNAFYHGDFFSEDEAKLKYPDFNNFSEIGKKRILCYQWAELVLYFKNCKEVIYFFDDDIAKINKKIKEAITGSRIVTWKADFDSKTELLELDCNCFGDVTTYGALHEKIPQSMDFRNKRMA